jgi:hypothetical protein
MRVHQKKRLTGGGSRPLQLSAAAAAALLCIYYLLFVEEDYSSPPSSFSLRQTAATSPFGVVIPQGRAVALPSVRISAAESAKIERSIYGGEGGEFALVQKIKDTHTYTHTQDIFPLTIFLPHRQGTSRWIHIL